MTIGRRICGWLIAALFFAAGVGHILKPEATAGLVPEFIPQQLAHLVAAVAELAVGVGVFVPKLRDRALLLAIALLAALLPLHIVDLLREAPVIGSKTAAIIRLPIQFVLAAMAWFARAPRA